MAAAHTDDDDALDQLLTAFRVAADDGLFDPDRVAAEHWDPGPATQAQVDAAERAAARLDPAEVHVRVGRRANLAYATPADSAAWLASALTAVRRRAGQIGSSSASQ